MKAVQVRRPEGWEPVDATIFLHGICGVFALALHHLLGYPIEVLLDDSEGEMWARLVHLYCPVEVREQQGYADVRGITTSWDGFLAEFADLSETWEHQKVDPDAGRDGQRGVLRVLWHCGGADSGRKLGLRWGPHGIGKEFLL